MLSKCLQIFILFIFQMHTACFHTFCCVHKHKIITTLAVHWTSYWMIVTHYSYSMYIFMCKLLRCNQTKPIFTCAFLSIALLLPLSLSFFSFAFHECLFILLYFFCVYKPSFYRFKWTTWWKTCSKRCKKPSGGRAWNDRECVAITRRAHLV